MQHPEYPIFGEKRAIHTILVLKPRERGLSAWVPELPLNQEDGTEETESGDSLRRSPPSEDISCGVLVKHSPLRCNLCHNIMEEWANRACRGEILLPIYFYIKFHCSWLAFGNRHIYDRFPLTLLSRGNFFGFGFPLLMGSSTGCSL